MATEKDDFTANFGADTTGFDTALRKLTKKVDKATQKIADSTATSAIAFAGLTTAIVFTTAAFADYEEGLIAVQKTSNLSDEETEKLGDELIALSKKAPLAIDQLLEIAEAAGQLGIQGRGNIVKFTDTIAKLGATTDLQGEDAAKTLARILNLTGENVDSVDKLGAAFVRLGNNVAASEHEIANLTREVAKSTAIFKIGAANATGIGASLAELGIQAEIGGSVVGRAFIKIREAIDNGGEGLLALSEATGIAADGLKGAFERDATDVFVRFLGTVKDIVESGGNATSFLESFGLKGQGVSKVIAPLALRVADLSVNLQRSANEFENTTALEEEFAIKSKAVSAQLQVAKNKIDAAAVTLGEKFAPTVVKVVTSLADFVDKLNDLDEDTIETIATIGLFATGVAAVTLGLGLAAKAVIIMKVGLLALASPLGLITTAISVAAGGIGFLIDTVNDLNKATDASADAETALAEQLEFAAQKRKEFREKSADDIINIQKDSFKKELDAEKTNNNALANVQKELTKEQLAELKKANKNYVDETLKLFKAREKILKKGNKKETKLDKDAAKLQLKLTVAELKKEKLVEENASREAIERQEEEIGSLETIQELAADNREIAADENATALDLINQEKNRVLLEQEQDNLDKIQEEQRLHNDEFLVDIGDFERDTQELIDASFEKKLTKQKEALADLDSQLNDLTLPGSYPSQLADLDASELDQSNSSADHYAAELIKHQKFLDDKANQTPAEGSSADAGAATLAKQNELRAIVVNTNQILRQHAGFNESPFTASNFNPTLSDPSSGGSPKVQSRPSSSGTPRNTGQNVTVEIDIAEGAVSFITAKQVENNQLGIA